MQSRSTRSSPSGGRGLRLALLASVFIVIVFAGGLMLGRTTKDPAVQQIAGGDTSGVAAARGLNAQDVENALSTFVPPGRYDDYYMFASGGHSGQIFVIGLPSMRILKTIAVFTPEPWQGYGYGNDWSAAALAGGRTNVQTGNDITWADTHHPALSETNGAYDGRFLYVSDKGNGRVAMVDLRDFRTKQTIALPNHQSTHGGAFVTPNSEYVHVSSNTPTVWPPAPDAYASLDQYKEKFRGVSSWLAIDQKTGQIDMARSFQIELPPYTQDLADAGKGPSHGWGFINTYNSEMATGGKMEGKPPIESGASAGSSDFLHIINWKKGEEIVKAGKFETINGSRVIPMKVAVDEGVLVNAPVVRSPHGADVTPDGKYIIASGKLDPHATVYSFEKIQRAVAAKNYEGTDPFGIPILKFNDIVEAQVELGAGPLHTQFDNKGYAYTSLFLESAVAKWKLGDWKLVEKISVHYNIGHLAVAEGDNVNPAGSYLVALNKWSVDRFPDVGPLHPQNLQLIDIGGEKMKLRADMPMGIGEPHYAQIVRRTTLKSLQGYPGGTDALTLERHKHAIDQGQERVERRPGVTEVWMSAMRSHFTPDVLRVKKGDRVILHITNVETGRDTTHGFTVSGFNVQTSLEPGEATTVEFVADKAGSYAFYCTEFCSALHMEMQGWLLVEP
jgi:nitrous-oxide reductase